MDRLIDKVLEIIELEDKWLLNCNSHNENTRIAFDSMKSKIKAIPSAEPTWAINDKGEKVAFQDMPVNKAIFLLKLMDAYHEGMTKGEIMHKLFPNDYFVVGEYGFDEKWWNSPYEPQESEVKE